MTDVWTSQELDHLGTADEIQISPRRLDGSDDPFTTIWVVRVDDGLYVRSWRGSRGRWYQHALSTGTGRIRGAGIGRDLALTRPAPKERSLLTVAALTTRGNTEQLTYHLGLAKQNGVTEAELIEAITHLAFYAGWPKAFSAMTVAKQVFAQ